jgi:predicted amidohydrolase YtcJ
MKLGSRVAMSVLIFGFLTVNAASAQKKSSYADTVVLHGRIYTLNPSQPWAEALAIRGDRIVAVGSDSEVKLQSKHSQVIDRKGRLVLPGFADCHIHFIDGAFSLGRVNLAGAKDPADMQTSNPFEGIQTAVTRQTSEGLPKDGFVPSQRLSVAEAIRGYTLGAAYAGFREKTEGSLESGKLADLIILSQNLFEVDTFHQPDKSSHHDRGRARSISVALVRFPFFKRTGTLDTAAGFLGRVS